MSARQLDWAVVRQLAKKELLDRYAGSVLGGMWTFIQPLLNMLVFILVFSQIMRARLPDAVGEHSYSIYLISGLLGWIAFASTLMRSTTMFIDNGPLIKKVAISLGVFPVAIVLSDTVIFALSFGAFLVFVLLVGHPLGASLLWLLLLFSLQQAFAVSLGSVLGTLSVFFRDIKEGVGVVLQLWFWLTPIVYVADILPEAMRVLLWLNPMYPVIDGYHQAVLFGQAPNLPAIALLLLGTLGLFGLGRWLLRRLEGDIRDLI